MNRQPPKWFAAVVLLVFTGVFVMPHHHDEQRVADHACEQEHEQRQDHKPGEQSGDSCQLCHVVHSLGVTPDDSAESTHLLPPTATVHYDGAEGACTLSVFIDDTSPRGPPALS